MPGAAEQATGFTKLLQDLGNAVYKIEKRGVPHFGVTTPYLAAVVKGTTFSITVDDRGSTLQVVEGAVEVATPDGGARDLILPAGVASVSAGDRFRLTVHGDHERVVDSPARPTAPASGATPSAAPAGPADAAPPPASADLSATAADVPAVADVIVTPVASRPVDLSAFSGGLVTGTAGFTALTAAVTQSAKAASAVRVPAIVPAMLASTDPVVVIAVAAPAATTSIAPAAAVAVAPATAVATTPVAAAAVATEPVIVAPVVAAPAVTAPVVTAPVVTAPVVTAPVVAASFVPAPVVTSPVVTAPVVTAPTVAAPVVVSPPAVVTTPVTSASATPPAANTIAVPKPAVPTPVAPPAAAPIVAAPIVTAPVLTVTVTLPAAPKTLDPLPSGDDDNGSIKIKSNNGRHLGELKH